MLAKPGSPRPLIREGEEGGARAAFVIPAQSLPPTYSARESSVFTSTALRSPRSRGRPELSQSSSRRGLASLHDRFRLDEPQHACPLHGVAAAARVELPEKIAQMPFDGRGPDVQRSCDLLIRIVAHKEREYLSRSFAVNSPLCTTTACASAGRGEMRFGTIARGAVRAASRACSRASRSRSRNSRVSPFAAAVSRSSRRSCSAVGRACGRRHTGAPSLRGGRAPPGAVRAKQPHRSLAAFASRAHRAARISATPHIQSIMSPTPCSASRHASRCSRSRAIARARVAALERRLHPHLLGEARRDHPRLAALHAERV